MYSLFNFLQYFRRSVATISFIKWSPYSFWFHASNATYLSDSPQPSLATCIKYNWTCLLLLYFILQGSNGNKIHIFYEGSGDTTSEVAEPKIQPCNLNELTPDEQDLVKLQIEQNKRGKVNVGTQTDPVIVIGPGDLLPAINPIGSSAVMAILAQIQDTLTEMLENMKALCKDVQELNETADEILDNLCWIGRSMFKDSLSWEYCGTNQDKLKKNQETDKPISDDKSCTTVDFSWVIFWNRCKCTSICYNVKNDVLFFKCTNMYSCLMWNCIVSASCTLYIKLVCLFYFVHFYKICILKKRKNWQKLW